MTVVDAALVSRFYDFQKTLDGGEHWTVVNPDPFGQTPGVTDGIYFKNDSLGFLSLANASGDYAAVYRTEDSGTSFLPIVLPMEEVPETEEPKENYQYMSLPWEEDAHLKLKLTTERSSHPWGGTLLFRSEDHGKHWTYETYLRE